MATKTAISGDTTALQRQFELGEFRLPDQQLLKRVKSLESLAPATSRYGEIAVDFAAVKANATKTQKVQKLYQEAQEFYKFGMCNLAFDVCKEALNVKSEDQFTNSLLEKLLVNIQSKKDENESIELSGKEKEFNDQLVKCALEIREIKKEKETLSNEQKFKIYSRIYEALFHWGVFLNDNNKSNDVEKSIRIIKKYKKAFNVNEILLQIDSKNVNFLLQKGHVQNNIGLGYVNLKKYTKAMAFYQKALEYYNQAIEMDADKKSAVLDSLKKDLAQTYRNIANIHMIFGNELVNKKQYKDAYSEYEKGIEMTKKSLEIDHVDEVFKTLGALYTKTAIAISKIPNVKK
ncbi:MAG: hypothetical protein KR126chlam6_00789 [Candidatus Anoxychlamydiales bacterium]|nr:hypothetical protein [Candidatus Anoxychlamydiales bacterium]